MTNTEHEKHPEEESQGEKPHHEPHADLHSHVSHKEEESMKAEQPKLSKAQLSPFDSGQIGKHETSYKEKLAELKHMEQKLRRDIEREMHTIKVMDHIVRERHQNLEMHEKKIVELKTDYEKKLNAIVAKEQEVLRKEKELDDKRKTVLDELKNIERERKKSVEDKHRIEKDILRGMQKRNVVDHELVSRQKKLEVISKREKDIAKEIDLRVSDLSRRQRHFEELFRANKLLEEKHKSDSDRHKHILSQLEQKELHLKTLEKKVGHLAALDQKIVSEQEKHKLDQAYTLISRISSHSAKKDVASAKLSYESLRNVYKELGQKGRQKVYKDIIKAQQSLHRLMLSHKPTQQ